MSFTNITDEELVGKGVTGLPDTPGLSTEDMQAQFDEYPAFLKDKFRTLISELEAVTGALNIGAVVPENITADGNIQSILDGLRQYVDDTVIALGTGDMATGIYDPNRDGVIAPAQGGTGQTSLQAVRNTMGLGNTLEALPIANGGTGQTTVEGVRSILGLGNTQGALPIANGGTGASSVEGARNALGLGNTSGALPIENGGTGQTTAAAARNALGLGNTTGALPVANGGTGKTSITSGTVLVGNGSNTLSERAINNTGAESGSNALSTANALYKVKRDLQTSFQAGVDAVYQACVAEGVTPSASTPTAIAQAISSIRNGGNAGNGQILSGYNAYSGKQLRSGSMTNYSNGYGRAATLTAQDGRHVYNPRSSEGTWFGVTNSDGVKSICVAVPNNGYWTTNDIVRIPESNLPEVRQVLTLKVSAEERQVILYYNGSVLGLLPMDLGTQQFDKIFYSKYSSIEFRRS